MSTETLTAQPGTVTWQIDPMHSHVEFAVKHMMISTVKGRFADVKGTVVLDEADLTSGVVDVTLAVASIDTRQQQRDDHLRSADFFDAQRFPTLHFVSKSVARHGDGFRVVGDLTIRDVTREVTLAVTDEGRGRDPWGKTRAGVSATTKIDRREFGLVYNQTLETGGILVGDEVKISVEAELVQA